MYRSMETVTSANEKIINRKYPNRIVTGLNIKEKTERIKCAINSDLTINKAQARLEFLYNYFPKILREPGAIKISDQKIRIMVGRLKRFIRIKVREIIKYYGQDRSL